MRKDKGVFEKVLATMLDEDVLYEDELVGALMDDAALNEFIEQAIAL